jgi:DNA polymerase-3 subunit alpha
MAEDEFSKLVEEVKKGWVARFSRPIFGHKPSEEEIPIYKSRLAYEMGVLKKMGFSGYFLLVQDIVQWAKGNNIMVGPGRGSCFLPDHRVKLSHYGLTKAIQDIKVGDEVIAHDGSFQKVIATLQFERNEEIIDLEFDNGIRISCTRDHKFFTRNRGWVAAEDLTEEDEFEDVEELSRGLKSSSLKEAD